MRASFVRFLLLQSKYFVIYSTYAPKTLRQQSKYSEECSFVLKRKRNTAVQRKGKNHLIGIGELGSHYVEAIERRFSPYPMQTTASHLGNADCLSQNYSLSRS